MRGNCKHEVGDEPINRCVSLANDEDPHYFQVFETAAELDEFIQQLADARQAVFGSSQTWTLEP